MIWNGHHFRSCCPSSVTSRGRILASAQMSIDYAYSRLACVAYPFRRLLRRLIRDVSWGIKHNSFSISLVKNKSHKSKTQGFKCWLILDCKTVGFFLKISKEIGKAWRKSLKRAKRLASLQTFLQTFFFQPRCRPFVWLLPRTWIRKNTDCFAV